jgi:hypothetical protein
MRTGKLYNPYIITPTSTTKTADYSITTSDLGGVFVMNADDHVFTLPSVGADEDGSVVTLIQNKGKGGLVIQPSDSDSIADSGAGYGIETKYQCFASVTLRYIHSLTQWVIINIAGAWKCEGLGFLLSTTDSSGNVTDLANQYGEVYTDMSYSVKQVVSGYVPQVVVFNGTTSTIVVPDPWDIYNSLTDDWTIFARVRFDNMASYSEAILGFYEDADNFWNLMRSSTGELWNRTKSGGVSQIDIVSGGSMGQYVWYDVVLAKKGTAIGTYIDGAQTGHDTLSSAFSIAGGLYVGQNGASANYFDGQIAELFIANQNIFNADPQTDDTDSITIPEKYIKLIYGE